MSEEMKMIEEEASHFSYFLTENSEKLHEIVLKLESRRIYLESYSTFSEDIIENLRKKLHAKRKKFYEMKMERFNTQYSGITKLSGRKQPRGMTEEEIDVFLLRYIKEVTRISFS
jgi:uncharacterized coiled-coil protein SlyX